uniref:Uncharacterized protein n=1 Tax=Magallana gigas TaxID=29159 RepID=A0A8W8INJ1_MAGGI
MSRSRVPGYREGLKVYQTFTCPWTESAWTSASLRMNCSVGGDQPFNHYYCIPNAERTHFVEFCYDRASMKTEKGNCWELGGIGYLNQVDCTNFVKGCPDYTYLSEQVYKRRNQNGNGTSKTIAEDQKDNLSKEISCHLTSQNRFT